MSQEILGMDPINFMLTILSILGICVSVTTFMYHYDPCRQYLLLSETVDQTWSLFESIRDESLLSIDVQMRLCRYLESLEIELRSLMFVTGPNINVSQKLRGWSMSWSLLCLSIRVQKLNAVLMTISKQKRRIFYAAEVVRRTGTSLASPELEATIKATTERLIIMLGDYDVESASLKGINDPSPRLSSSTSVTRGTPPTTLKSPSDRVPFPTYPGLQMPPKSYQPERKKVGNGLIH